MTEVLKVLPEAAGRGQHFQARGHSFSLYGSTRSRTITFLSFFFLAVNWLPSGFAYATLSLNWLYAPSTNLSRKRKNNERTSEYLQDKLEKDVLKKRFISNYFKLVPFRLPVSSAFSDVSRPFEILRKVRK